MQNEIRVPLITFLARMSPNEAGLAIARFSQRYRQDWQEWTNTYQPTQIVNNLTATATQFGRILRGWQATRPNPMRRPRGEASHPPPYLEDLLVEARPYLRAIGNLTVRNIMAATAEQTEALKALWDIFCELTYNRGRATCVGITKAVLLLTEGRIGPAFDCTVRGNLCIHNPLNSIDWIANLCAISQDIYAFETTNGICIETLVPAGWSPIHVGRVYDMIVGPR